MNNRTRATIIGYVGTTISLMNDQRAWKAAIELGKKNVQEIDAWLPTLSQDLQDELEPLVKVLRNPRLLIQNEPNIEPAYRFILEQITIQAQETLANPPSPQTNRSIADITAEIQQRQAAMRVSAVTGNDRLDSAAPFPGGTAHDLAWYNTPEGQAYLYGTNVPRELEEIRAALLTGVHMAIDHKKIIRNLLVPYQHRVFGVVSSWLPQNYYVQTGAWWLTAGFVLAYNVGVFANNIQNAGSMYAITSFVTQGFRSADEEDERANRRTGSAVMPARNNWLSIWQSPARNNNHRHERENPRPGV